MAIPKYKDPITGKWNRITTYGQSGNAVEITEISGETALSDDIITELNNDLNWISYGGGAYRFVSAEEDKRLYSYITEDKISQILVNTLTKTCVLRETQITSASVADSIVKRDSYGEIPVSTPSRDSSATNKAYVDEADKLLRLKLSNLEQALNGYILDTTKEAYADLDSAVLKNSVAVGENVYPIADKTRALVTRIEGKTTKMVQLANTEAVLENQIQNGITLIKNADGSFTANGTSTAKTWGLFVTGGSGIKTVAGSKYLLLGSPNGYGLDTYYLSDGGGRISEGVIKTLDGSSLSIRAVFTAGFVAENITIKPQLFNLTAIYGEGNEPTTVKQFKADFPNAFYPYAEGNIYPAKISGVKFYENQDKSGEQASVTLPETYDLHGIGDYKDYLEITKNEGNELYTLKKVQSVEVNESDKTITPLATPVETVIATNLTYEQVTAIRHNGGLIEVEGNTNKGYARPTVTNTIVYRLTAANTTEG